ncbi:MAG: hypothetical protein KBH01_01820 [Breznakibacter sp.]|nr:hypothetical protein [Breznakibacter sp.]
MGYIFQFFETVIDDVLKKYNDESDNIHYKELSEEIEHQVKTVVEKLRATYYSEKKEEDINIYLTKLLSRLTCIKKSLEDKIYNLEQTVLTTLPSQSTALINCYDVYLGIMDILAVFVNEFNINIERRDEILSFNVEVKSETGILNDHYEVVQCMLNDIEVPDEILETYHLKKEQIKLLKPLLLMNENNRLKKNFCIKSQEINHSFEELFNGFMSLYHCNTGGYNGLYYQQVFEFLHEELAKIEDKNDKNLFLINFYFHTGLCTDIVVNYFDKELGSIEFEGKETEMANSLSNILAMVSKAEANPRFQKYSIERIDGQNMTFSRLKVLFTRYREKYDIKELHVEPLQLNISLENFAAIIGRLRDLGYFKGSKEDIGNAFASILQNHQGQPAASTSFISNMSSKSAAQIDFLLKLKEGYQQVLEKFLKKDKIVSRL